MNKATKMLSMIAALVAANVASAKVVSFAITNTAAICGVIYDSQNHPVAKSMADGKGIMQFRFSMASDDYVFVRISTVNAFLRAYTNMMVVNHYFMCHPYNGGMGWICDMEDERTVPDGGIYELVNRAVADFDKIKVPSLKPTVLILR